jgi:hypothetical protein
MAFQTLGKVFDHSWQLSCHSLSETRRLCGWAAGQSLDRRCALGAEVCSGSNPYGRGGAKLLKNL